MKAQLGLWTFESKIDNINGEVVLARLMLKPIRLWASPYASEQPIQCSGVYTTGLADKMHIVIYFELANLIICVLSIIIFPMEIVIELEIHVKVIVLSPSPCASVSFYTSFYYILR